MRKLLTAISNLLFPQRETEILLRPTTGEQMRDLFRPDLFKESIFLCPYKEKMVTAAIIENKFHNNKRATALLANLLDQWHQKQTLTTLYLPIPLGPKRKRERGYNQVENILKNVNSPINFNPDLLKRKIETPPQTTLNKSERTTNMQNVFSFSLNNLDLNQYQQIVILDDVVTTGGTLESAKAAVRPRLPSHITLKCLAIAH